MNTLSRELRNMKSAEQVSHPGPQAQLGWESDARTVLILYEYSVTGTR